MNENVLVVVAKTSRKQAGKTRTISIRNISWKEYG
jgi:hypothetical protein